MATDVKSGAFNTGTGAVSSTTQVTGLGFTPKLIFFHWSGRTDSTDAIGRRNKNSGWGWTIGTGAGNNASTDFYSSDNVGTTDPADYMTEANCISVSDGAGGTAGLMALQSFDASGFTLVVNDVMPFDMRVIYLAVGGTDITNLDIGNELAPAAGSLGVTSPGFQPDIVFFMTHGDDNALPDGAASREGGCFGAAMSSTMQAVWTGATVDLLTTTDTGAYIYNDECAAQIDFNTSTVVRRRADLTSMDANGFTLNIAEGGGNWTIGWLAVKGSNWSINGITTQTDTVTDIDITGLSFAPEGGIVVSGNRAVSTQDVATPPDSVSFGTFDSTTSRQAMAMIDEDNVATNSEVTTAVEHDAVYANIDTSSAIQGLMDVKSMNSDGVTFIMDDADPSASYCFVITVGEPETGLSIDISPGNYQEPGIVVYP